MSNMNQKKKLFQCHLDKERNKHLETMASGFDSMVRDWPNPIFGFTIITGAPARTKMGSTFCLAHIANGSALFFYVTKSFLINST